MAEDQNIDNQMSDLMRDKVREVKAEGLSGQVKVLSKRALMDIVDQLIRAYGGLENQELISKIAEYELMSKQMETKAATLQGKVELYESQLAEIRKEDDDLRAKLKADESRLPMLEEQNEVLKKTIQGFEAEAQNLRRELGDSEASAQDALDKAIVELEELRARVAEVEPRIAAAEAAKKEAEARLHDKLAAITDLEDRVHEVEDAKEKALADSREKIARLENALQGSDARKRIVELENEVSDLQKKLEAREVGLEFVDVEDAPRFDEAEAELKKLEEALSGVPSGDERALPIRESLVAVRDQIEEEKETFPRITEMMYENKGTVAVACELAKLLVRHADLHEEIKALKTAAGLLS
jgi:chromosome segregation ATPase